MNPSHLPSITCPLPGIFLSMNDINTNYFPCLMLFHVFNLGSVANLHSSIYILNNDTFQFNISLDITFPIFRNCVTPTHICFLPLHSEFQLCCWVGRILTGVSWFQRKQSHSGRKEVIWHREACCQNVSHSFKVPVCVSATILCFDRVHSLAQETQLSFCHPLPLKQ